MNEQDKVGAWWAALEGVRKLVLTAGALSLVSQFFKYRTASGGGGFLTGAMDTDHYTGHVFFAGTSAANGWSVHPLALPIYAALAYVYLTKTYLAPWWDKWGYWATAALFFLLWTPAEPFNTAGGFLGLIAFGLALWAAWRHHKSRGAAPPPAE